ncbi:hypothetical protein [Sphingomonas sp.]|jgi:hypothetical protein|uniref:hypothetical protein n=1 Tax=Sphingomonas sp. TaxID=28214 RepID=UPI002ED913A9
MKRLAALLAIVATPATAQTRCVTDVEAQAFASVAMPEIIRQTGRVCATALPATSLVRRATGPFLAKYDAEANRAWPVARTAIVKLSDPAMEMLVQSEFARPLITSLLVPQLVGRIAVGDCPTIDRLIALLEPLPPRNTAGIVVATLKYLKAEKAKGRTVDVPDLPLCAEPR